MAPDATFRELLDAIADGNIDRTLELTDALSSWLKKGGFPPITIGSAALGHDWHRHIASEICNMAMVHARRMATAHAPTDD
ncbi:MAG: hypothetical protein KDA80_21020 [Planctomycetaceae bacterium]|nr:hypothetical protein [Planctomycetaceae bacterium]